MKLFEKIRKDRIHKMYLKLKQNAYDHIIKSEVNKRQISEIN